MKNAASLTRDQVTGKAPITKAQIIAGLEAADEEFREGRTIPMPRTWAEFRKVVLGLDDEKVPRRAFFRSAKRLRQDTR